MEIRRSTKAVNNTPEQRASWGAFNDTNRNNPDIQRAREAFAKQRAAQQAQAQAAFESQAQLSPNTVVSQAPIPVANNKGVGGLSSGYDALRDAKLIASYRDRWAQQQQQVQQPLVPVLPQQQVQQPIVPPVQPQVMEQALSILNQINARTPSAANVPGDEYPYAFTTAALGQASNAWREKPWTWTGSQELDNQIGSLFTRSAPDTLTPSGVNVSGVNPFITTSPSILEYILDYFSAPSAPQRVVTEGTGDTRTPSAANVPGGSNEYWTWYNRMAP